MDSAISRSKQHSFILSFSKYLSSVHALLYGLEYSSEQDKQGLGSHQAYILEEGNNNKKISGNGKLKPHKVFASVVNKVFSLYSTL